MYGPYGFWTSKVTNVSFRATHGSISDEHRSTLKAFLRLLRSEIQK